MKNIGIVAEYNPLHNGHLYHLTKTKEFTKSDNLICIMSGNFTQRGLPAIYDKWIRTEMALKSGVDLVIELPTYYALNSAEFFANYSIKILNKLGIIDTVSFGSEETDISKLKQIANILSDETIEFKEILKKELNLGISFAKARENAISKFLDNKDIGNLLQSSNNILAIEYLKALNKTSSNITPLNIARTNCNYTDTDINSDICSATAIRHLLDKENISENDVDLLKRVVPNTTFDLMINNDINSTSKNSLKAFEKEIIYLIRKMPTNELKEVLEVTEGLENTFKKYCYETDDIYELIDLVISKRFTKTKIQRIFLHILLDMTKSEFNDIEKQDIQFIRVLGFNKKGKELLNEISNNTDIPVITSVKRYVDKYGLNKLFEKDILSSNIYCKKNNIDYTKKITCID